MCRSWLKRRAKFRGAPGRRFHRICDKYDLRGDIDQPFLTLTSFTKSMENYKADIEECKKKEPEASGLLKLDIKIASDNVAFAVQANRDNAYVLNAGSHEIPPKVLECLQGKIAGWSFLRPALGAETMLCVAE